MRSNRKRDLVFIIIVLLLGIGLGYATLNATLSIDGTTDIIGNKWDVHIDEDSFDVINGMISLEDELLEGPVVEDNKITFRLHLTEPGEFICVKFDVVNAGTIDAMVDETSFAISTNSDQNPNDFLSTDVSYISGAEIQKKQLLAAGDHVTVRFYIKYNEVETLSPDTLPQSNQTITISLQASYVQANEDAHSIGPQEVYSFISQSLKVGDDIPFVNFDNIHSNMYAVHERFAIKHTVDESKILSSILVLNLNGNTYEFLPRSETSMVTTLNSAFGSENCAEVHIPIGQLFNIDYYYCALPSGLAAYTDLNGTETAIIGYKNSDNLLDLNDACAIFYEKEEGKEGITSFCNEEVRLTFE